MVVDEYLVKISGLVDQSGLSRFHQALREAANVSEVSAASIAGAFVKAQTEIIGGFVAIGGAALGLVDKVAMADQNFRLLALHMHISKEAARSLKVTMDALGQPIEHLWFDKELNHRAEILIADQRAMAPTGDFDAQMLKIRDIRFEFTRMEVALETLSWHVVQDFMRALGTGPDEVLAKLRELNAEVTHNLPAISAKVVAEFLPVWKDVVVVFNAVLGAAEAVGTAFTNVVGIWSGDTAIMGATFSFEKFAEALTHVVDVFKDFVLVGTSALSLMAHLYSAIALAEVGDFSGAKKEAAAGWADLRTGVGAGLRLRGVDTNEVKSDVGDAATGSLAGAIDIATGLPISRVVLRALGVPSGGSTAPSDVPVSGQSIHDLISGYAKVYDVDPALAHAIGMHESGETQYDASGNVLKNPKSSARGAMQLLDMTARGLGVDSHDPKQNVEGGVRLLHQMLLRYHGDVPKAIGAYGVGAGDMDAILAGRATKTQGARETAIADIASVLRGMGKTGDVHVGSIVVHVDRPGATNADVGRVVARHVQDLRNKQVQRNLAEFQDQSWGSY